MAPSKIRKALGAVKDKTSISLAKVNSNALSDLDVAIVKATRHDEQPAEEKHIREVINLTSYSRAYVSACINMLSKRLNKTKNWTVALKTLILIHRLLLEGDSAYEKEIFFATRRGTRLLNLSDFRDGCHSNSWDYSAFVRTYALYLDQRIEFRMQGKRSRSKAARKEVAGEEPKAPTSLRSTPVREMKTERIFNRIQHLQQFLERFLACRPTGEARTNRIVIVALYPVVKESFQIYYDIAEVVAILVDRFMEFEVPNCVKVHEIFTRLSKQFEELDKFFSWCKSVGVARSSEYPEVEKITSKKLQFMDELIRDKSIISQSRKIRNQEIQTVIVEEQTEEDEEVVEDMTTTKALPPPEESSEDIVEEVKELEVVQESNEQQEVDLLNLFDESVTVEDQADKLALALFDGGCASASSEPAAATPWEAFNSDDSTDWETALVESASHLSNQKMELGGGFNMLMLDGMYQQQAASNATMSHYGATGSASSVAFGSVGMPAMLALPAPPASGDDATATTSGGDPFAASLSVLPPSYVQMSEMEKKQKLLVEEQLMWQQYAKDGMQGHVPGTNLQVSPYNVGGCTPRL
ncbi:PREDICTED: putative clathrin assembly protein At1g03050 [Nelumbo nucifera]|uniref:Clathrin assembly protein At1g03050 n=1 Tax=Nelumbo nucifera TaxID=4432 RepID=A0A1U8A2R0_NELNU|nr:PREDICTED: putative clathrin assembly protein At1g03050 [Nelumbo nucifera]